MGLEEDTDSFEEFQQYLRDALAHLYDPTYTPPELLWAVMDCDPQQGVESVWEAIVQAIENLKPAPDVPPGARITRIYKILSCRYVQDLTQEETAERLGITARHLRREQQPALSVLAQRVWERSAKTRSPAGDRAPEKRKLPVTTDSVEWRSQVRNELSSLEETAPGIVANVGEAAQRVAELGRALTSEHGVELYVEPMPPDLSVTIHPSALDQILVKAIGKVVQHMSSGQITLGAERERERVTIQITGHPVKAERSASSDLIREILATQGGSIEANLKDNRMSFWVELPSADKMAVLVVDDNVDLVHFYQRYTTGTRYEIVHVAEGQRVFDTIAQSVPDIIVLDIMLPDIDGWELLTNLHEHPVTRSIPVIVCSVVRMEELALALGAALYVPKPVRRQELIQALDHVLSQASAKATRAPVSNAAAC